MNRIRLFLVLLSTLGFTLLVIHAQDDMPVFDFLDNPIVLHGNYPDWDSRHTGPGVIVYHEGQYHMFRNGYQGWPLPSQVGYMISDDGVEWEEVQENPVFYHEQIPFDVDLAMLTAAFIDNDGLWNFYFNLIPESNETGSIGIIRATTTSPTEEWTMDDVIYIPRGNEGEWDSGFIGLGDIVEIDEVYHFYYAGTDGNGNYGIGLATSIDGIAWEKHPSPLLVDTLDTWEVDIQDPRVVTVDDGYVMLYSSFNSNGRNQGYNFAFSEDGVLWERLYDNPVVPPNTFRRSPWVPELMYNDDTYYVYLEVDNRAGTDIFVGMYSGDLLP